MLQDFEAWCNMLTPNSLVCYCQIAMLNKNIRKFRKRAGMTQRQLQDKVGASINSVRNWEQGRNCFSALLVPRVVRALGVTYAELFRGVK